VARAAALVLAPSQVQRLTEASAGL
jgi:hypothetical protein